MNGRLDNLAVHALIKIVIVVISVTDRGGRNVVIVDGVRTPFLTSGTM